MRRLALLPLVLVAAGCGEAERTPALAPVRLTVTAPADQATVEDDTVEVRGTVLPRDARVVVAGAEADVDGGEFHASVSLDAGANVIDVQAGAPQHPAAMAAIVVVRLVPVPVPDVEGMTAADAIDALEAAGLRAEPRDVGGLLDGLLPGGAAVCGTDPDAGEQVRPGSTVVVATAKSC